MSVKPEENQENKPTFSLSKIEKEILAFWKDNKIFEKSVKRVAPKGDYVFYDGPPYATGLPHIGHLLVSTIKDVVPRYKTMKGHRVERRFGWDCHGLPIEVLVEKELGLNSKKEIETYGVGNFNAKCQQIVLRYVDEWKKTITRLGRWVDFGNDYKTMDLPFMESTIWVFKELYDKGLVYEDFRSSLYCTRCETPLSKMETTMDDSYEDVEDPSIYVAFEIKNKPNIYFLSWTTTPWTLSANVALAVNAKAEYVEVELTAGEEPWVGRHLILAKERLMDSLTEGTYEVKASYAGQEFIGWQYEPIQKFIEPEKPAYRVVAGDFVTLNEGTGIVHIAPAFGEDDFELGRKENLPVVLTVDDGGKFISEITPWAGQYIKDADSSITEDLKKRGIIFKEAKVTHSYPFCWRCHKPLIYKVQKSFYVKVSELKKGMFKTNEKIHWVPEHLKEGRFKLGIESAPDWGVSRKRYWGVPIPVWRCEQCNKEEVLGSIKEIEEKSGKKVDDLHRPMIDEVSWACKCGGQFKRVADVLDVWFDSGSMPYGQMHYPFANKKQFEATFPADFIVEYIPQTRGWFYTLHVLSNALFKQPAFKNVVATGTILAEDGTKMSKSKGNMPDSNKILDNYGSDALRLWLLQGATIQGGDTNYSEEQIVEGLRKVLLPLLNVHSFFSLYAPVGQIIEPMVKPKHVLDRWVMARLEETRRDVEEGMEKYELWKAVKPLAPFINDLSTWYVRRSRDRFKGEDAKDKTDALATLFTVLLETAKILAPFTPFIAENIYQKLKPHNGSTLDSVHLEMWPEGSKKYLDDKLVTETENIRKIIEIGHGMRAEKGIKVRQPIISIEIKGSDVDKELEPIMLNELNVKTVGPISSGNFIKEVIVLGGHETTVAFDLAMTPELVSEGLRREFVRQINALRKKLGFTIQDRAEIIYTTNSSSLKQMIDSYVDALTKETLSTSFVIGEGEYELKINSEVILVTLNKV